MCYKRFILTLFSLFIISNLFCQEKIKINKVCCYYDERVATELYTFKADEDINAALNLITSASGLTQNYKVIAANVPNACATLIYNKKSNSFERYIIYNQTFIYNITNKVNYWASICILAHEVGHHLNGHSLLPGGSRPNIELEADKFSGFVLAKLGASLEEAQSAIQSLASEFSSSTHPPRSARLAAIANGWYQNHQQTKKESTDSSESLSIIGRSIKIGGLEIAQFDFPNLMTLKEAKIACSKLGNGWRLPTIIELNLMYNNRYRINNLILKGVDSMYRSSSEECIYFGNGVGSGNTYSVDTGEELSVRAVR